MANWKLNFEKLEKAFEEAKENGYEPVYRICEGRTQYSIHVESEATGKSVYSQNTGDWSEIVNFCATHCNPGYDLIDGLGCTDDELTDATLGYIHSLGKKYRYK